jgi:hypothetical protein
MIIGMTHNSNLHNFVMNAVLPNKLFIILLYFYFILRSYILTIMLKIATQKCLNSTTESSL